MQMPMAALFVAVIVVADSDVIGQINVTFNRCSVALMSVEQGNRTVPKRETQHEPNDNAHKLRCCRECRSETEAVASHSFSLSHFRAPVKSKAFDGFSRFYPRSSETTEGY